MAMARDAALRTPPRSPLDQVVAMVAPGANQNSTM
uniref:Uncharacterized protein n=1 Tax=Arundo donax TaxID=35708 RepID=A0A0A9HGE9_ARUDO